MRWYNIYLCAFLCFIVASFAGTKSLEWKLIKLNENLDKMQLKLDDINNKLNETNKHIERSL